METKISFSQRERGPEMGDDREKRRALVVGGSRELNRFREPRGQRFPGWSQRADVAGVSGVQGGGQD